MIAFEKKRISAIPEAILTYHYFLIISHSMSRENRYLSYICCCCTCEVRQVEEKYEKKSNDNSMDEIPSIVAAPEEWKTQSDEYVVTGNMETLKHDSSEENIFYIEDINDDISLQNRTYNLQDSSHSIDIKHENEGTNDERETDEDDEETGDETTGCSSSSSSYYQHYFIHIVKTRRVVRKK